MLKSTRATARPPVQSRHSPVMTEGSVGQLDFILSEAFLLAFIGIVFLVCVVFSQIKIYFLSECSRCVCG